MKLLLIPLTIMFLLTIFALLGVGSGGFGVMTMATDQGNSYYYDYTGHPILYIANLSNVGEKGIVVQSAIHGLAEPAVAAWYNGTIPWNAGLIIQTYPLYYDTGHEYYVNYDDLGKTYDSGVGSSVTLSTSLGFFALVVGVMALSFVIGLRILGSGTSDFSVGTVVKGTAFIAIWGAMSATTMGLIMQVPLSIGGILYVALSLMYLVGVLNQFGHPEDN